MRKTLLCRIVPLPQIFTPKHAIVNLRRHLLKTKHVGIVTESLEYHGLEAGLPFVAREPNVPGNDGEWN